MCKTPDTNLACIVSVEFEFEDILSPHIDAMQMMYISMGSFQVLQV